jgi:hypothetical protein
MSPRGEAVFWSFAIKHGLSDRDDGDDDEDEGNAAHPLTPVSNTRLFDLHASPTDILQDIQKIVPALSPKQPSIPSFLWRLAKRPHVPRVIPTREQNRWWWASTDPERHADDWWDSAIEDEPILPSPPEWLPQDKALIVKPTGTYKIPLLVVGTHALGAVGTTIHPWYSTTNDMSNMWCSQLLYKARI